MTLKQWAKGVRVQVQEYGLARVVPDVRAIEHTRTWLWDLDDYRVSSVTGGSIWLIPKREE